MPKGYNGKLLITKEQVIPPMSGYEVVGVFNPGVTEYENKTVLLLRVAEKPVTHKKGVHLPPIYNPMLGKIELKEFQAEDKHYDFSDPRIIKEIGGKNFLTSISHLRIAVGSDDNFDVEDVPFIQVWDEYSTYGVEDARITRIDADYYISFTARIRQRYCDPSC